MQRVTHDSLIRFRAPPVLSEALQREASRKGMNLSEFLRSIAREKVGMS